MPHGGNSSNSRRPRPKIRLHLPPPTRKHNVTQWSYPTKCAQRPYIHVGNLWPGTFRAFMSFAKPSYKQVLKTILGFTEPCGVKLVMRDVDELQVFGNPDTATALIELPELAGHALLYWWLADIGVHLAASWLSVMHVYHYCVPTAYFGTAAVGTASQIMSGINDQFSALSLPVIDQDPGNWVQIGGSNIHPPLRGLYRVFYRFIFFGTFGQAEMEAGLHVDDGAQTRWVSLGHVSVPPGFTRELTGSTVVNAVDPSPVFNLGTWNQGPAFGCLVMPGSTMIVSSE